MNALTVIFGKMLELFYFYMKDYGMAIVCLTVLVKLCLLPFQLIQRKNMADQQADLSSCLLLLVQIPVMLCLYRSVSAGLTGQMGTRLFPWLKSLLTRDACGILPVLSVVVQMIPQTFPYIAYFRSLELPRPAPGMVLSTAVMTALICFPLPSGLCIYYLVSGIWSALEQTIWNVWRVRRLKAGQAPAG